MVPPGHRRRAVAAALVALTALAVSGCTTARTTAGSADTVPPATEDGSTGQPADDPDADRPSTVAVVGDSITVASAEPLEAALADLGLDVLAIDAQVGRRMTVGDRDRLHTGADIAELVSVVHEPELWVVALGTNDVGQYDGVDEVTAEVEALLERLPADVPLVWVGTWIRGREEQSTVVNDAVRRALADRPDSLVVDWSEHATGEGVLSGDGVHLTDGTGVDTFVAVVTEGVVELIGPPA